MLKASYMVGKAVYETNLIKQEEDFNFSDYVT